jgi:hypothetical protein
MMMMRVTVEYVHAHGLDVGWTAAVAVTPSHISKGQADKAAVQPCDAKPG